jgi:hypothetical protein
MIGQGYNTNLSKAQGIVPETVELLEIWEPGMESLDLKRKVHASGALAKETTTRVSDIVTRGFAQRYLIKGDSPAKWLKELLRLGINSSAFRQILLIHTARHNPIFHDFVSSTYWRLAAGMSGEIEVKDTRAFLEEAASDGRIQPRWADSMMVRVGRYLMGTLEDFQLIEKNRGSHRKIRPPVIFQETVRYLAADLHFSNTDDSSISAHPDWQLFGLTPQHVLRELEKAATPNLMIVQNGGHFVRIEWSSESMEEALNAIAH